MAGPNPDVSGNLSDAGYCTGPNVCPTNTCCVKQQVRPWPSEWTEYGGGYVPFGTPDSVLQNATPDTLKRIYELTNSLIDIGASDLGPVKHANLWELSKLVQIEPLALANRLARCGWGISHCAVSPNKWKPDFDC